MAFEFKLLTDEIRDKMFDFLKPKCDSSGNFNVANINWKTGVYDKESGIFLTLTYYLCDGIARCDMDFHSYIVIMDDGKVFSVSNDYNHITRKYEFGISQQYEEFSDKIKEGIEVYKKRYEYEKLLGADIREELKKIETAMVDRCHENFPIECEEDARELFIHNRYSEYEITNIYNKQTLSNFRKYATIEKIRIWRGDKYLQLLNEAVMNDNSCKKFAEACSFFIGGVNEAYDEQFLNVVKYMYAENKMGRHEELKLASYMEAYVEKYSDKLKNVIPLVEFVEIVAEDKWLKTAIETVKKHLEVREFPASVWL